MMESTAANGAQHESIDPVAEYLQLEAHLQKLSTEKNDHDRELLNFGRNPEFYESVEARERLTQSRARDLWLIKTLCELSEQMEFLRFRSPELQAYLQHREHQRNAGTREEHQGSRDQGEEEEQNPWLLAKPAPDFLAEEEKEFQGLAKDLLAPGALTLVDSPKGIGKTQVVHALAVALAIGGVFRGERVKAVKVLLLDRENPVSTLKKRLRAWGAATAANLHILTRQDAPDLKDRDLWAQFPAEDYDILIVDSVGASTEGITEKEGKQNSEVLATLLDLAHRGVAILLLQNTEKTGTNIRGRGEWADRADIQYEVRDATGFTPSGKKPWWLELPQDGAANWAERAARRKGRTVFRLAFIPAKFRLAAEPDPFCLEISLPEGAPWTLSDVTSDILQAGEDAKTHRESEKEELIQRATEALAEVVRDCAAVGNPILKTEAEEYLCEEHKLTHKDAREVIAEDVGVRWKIEALPAGRGKGTPKALFPLEQHASENPERQSKDPSGDSPESKGREGVYSDGCMNADVKVNGYSGTTNNGDSENDFTSTPGKSGASEKTTQNGAKNGGYRDTVYSDVEESEKDDLRDRVQKESPWEAKL